MGQKYTRIFWYKVDFIIFLEIAGFPGHVAAKHAQIFTLALTCLKVSMRRLW